MLLQETKNIGRNKIPTYAVPSDFCHLFSEEMNSLYLLALLLTADQELAEQCFASALKSCLKANGVFRDWARTWARRAIVQNAIGIMAEQTDEQSKRPSAIAKIASTIGDVRLAAVTTLDTFERFVFVLTILESYSDQECRVLLGCSPQDVIGERAQAFKHLGKSAEAPAVQTSAARDHAESTLRPGTDVFVPLTNVEPTVDFQRPQST